MKVLDLFSGIGGFSLGLERASMKTVAFCEIEPFCRAVLTKHWPGVPCYDDVRSLTGARLRTDDIVPDVICGGFPCQDISIAGRGAGLAGERSGLWREYARLIEEIRPRWVIIENVPALRTRGLDSVLGSLAALGYDAEWHLIPASAIGAPHQRDRVWIVAYPAPGGWREHGHERGQVGDAAAGQPAHGGENVAIAEQGGCKGRRAAGMHEEDSGATVPRGAAAVPLISGADILAVASRSGWGRVAPGMGGEADGLPRWVDGTRPVEAWEGNTPRTIGRGAPNRRPRLRGLGNSVVPQIPELIGRAIMRVEAAL